jgi:hypothetical protein
MVRIDRVSRSSGGTEDAVNVESDRAAERKARSDAVRLDLKAALRGRKTVSSDLSTSSAEATRASNSSSSSLSTSGSDQRGCSGCLPGGEDTGSRDRLGG